MTWQSKLHRTLTGLLGQGAASLILLSGGGALAGTVTYTFDTDPTTGANPIEIFQSGFTDDLGESVYWKAAGGNPGGFLGVTWPLGSSTTIALFPDIDNGQIVTSFRLEADLRIGNPQQNIRPADGFSINFARSNDPVFENHSASDFATSGAVETGTQTGIAISFDTWAGNALPDGADIEGIIVRVDNRTILRQAMPTRNGACDDDTSLQTGPRDLPYWTAAINEGRMPGAAFEPESWAQLCWQPLVVDLDDQSRLTVTWKGRTLLDRFQTTYFPSAGGLVLAGRTGGADQHTHFDNLRLTTTAITADTQPPTTPGNLRVTEAGAFRAALAWDASTDDSGRVAYEIEQNGTLLPGAVVDTTADIRDLAATTDYTFRVRATDVSGNKSDWVSVQTRTVASVPDPNFAALRIYGTPEEPVSGTAASDLLFDPRYPDQPDRIERLNGMIMSFGEPLFGDTFGDNIAFRLAGTVTPPESGQYRFFIRSDDGSQLYLNTSGPAIPQGDDASYIAMESGCCRAFLAPDDDLAPMFPTSLPVNLQAGQRYGILFIVNEGGGGDWGQVAWRREGDTTTPASLFPIGAPFFQSESVPQADPVGAVVNITQQPQPVTTVANETVTFNVAANTASPYTTDVIYQWFRNGVGIPGATGPTLTIPFVPVSETGSRYTVLVAVPGASATSSEATLTVGADTVPPTIASVATDGSFTRVVVNYSEPVTAATAAVAANYQISGGVTVSAAALSNTGMTATLTTSRMTENTDYTLTVNNVADTAGNVITANTASFHTWVFTLGKANYSYWSGIDGTGVAILTNNAAYPNNPTAVQVLDEFYSPVDWADNFGAVVSAWFIPPTTGNYVFFGNSDDEGQLYLSTDENPANKRWIAHESGWSGARQWVSVGGGSTLEDKRSDTFAATEWPTGNTITLQAGNRYYIEYIYKEGGGGDSGGATFKLANQPDPASGDPTALRGDVIGTYAPAEAGPGGGFSNVVVSADKSSLTLTFSGGTLESADAVTGPWTPVAGATSPATIPITGAGKFFRIR